MLLAALNLQAKDWPEFCGSPSRNLVADATHLPDSFVPGDKNSQKGEINRSTAVHVAWGVRTSSLTYPSPTVVGDKIFTGGREAGMGVFKCLDARDGRLLWEYAAPFRQFPESVDKAERFAFGYVTPNLGICATATVCDGCVYLVNHRYEVLCLDANGGAEPFVLPKPALSAGGKKVKDLSAPPALPPGVRGPKILWTFDLWSLGSRPSDACNSSPLVDGDFVYINTANGTDRDARSAFFDARRTPAPDAPNLVVFDKKRDACWPPTTRNASARKFSTANGPRPRSASSTAAS